MSQFAPDVLRQILRYDPEIGRVFWLHRGRAFFKNDRLWNSWNCRFAGQEAFTSVSPSTGYRQGTVLSCVMQCHRVAWAIFFWEWPENEIDHINGDRADNRLVNLRDVTRGENQKNTGLSVRNKSGVLGVSWDAARRKWLASIRVNGREIALGRFDNLDAAARARKEADVAHGFHANHGRKSQ